MSRAATLAQDGYWAGCLAPPPDLTCYQPGGIALVVGCGQGDQFTALREAGLRAYRFFQRYNVGSCSTRSKDLVEHTKCVFGGPAPRIALRMFIGFGNQGLSVLHVL